MKIPFLSFTCEDIGVAMVTNMISQFCYRIFLFFIRILTFWNKKYKYYCLYFSFLSGSPAKSGQLDLATKNSFPLFLVSKKALVDIYEIYLF